MNFARRRDVRERWYLSAKLVILKVGERYRGVPRRSKENIVNQVVCGLLRGRDGTRLRVVELVLNLLFSIFAGAQRCFPRVGQ